ncbi:DUF3039 domain-containing protein [Streptomyces montanus]|uniref:DUF3039 domain-containing protein n=1 Tax=Streptomyces montanus TaxID=2580423 RepID=UPI001BB21761|nr:DUF3039 domain-containing protein [Streptomyces montanus]
MKDDGAGDHDRLSHYVSKEDIVRSSMTGEPVFALCGKKRTPSKNPESTRSAVWRSAPVWSPPLRTDQDAPLF